MGLPAHISFAVCGPTYSYFIYKVWANQPISHLQSVGLPTHISFTKSGPTNQHFTKSVGLPTNNSLKNFCLGLPTNISLNKLCGSTNNSLKKSVGLPIYISLIKYMGLPTYNSFCAYLIFTGNIFLLNLYSYYL